MTFPARLQNGRPQLVNANRQTVMERVVAMMNNGRLQREEAIDRVVQEAFGDVIPRFHTVVDRPSPVRFYEHTSTGLVLTDQVFEVFISEDSDGLLQEISSRWDLLEGAFEMRREGLALENDLRLFYLARGYDRTNLTHTRPVLNGYQQGVCFYCGELMGEDVHVDHVIPRQFLHHDEIWNLVLSTPSATSRKATPCRARHT